MTASTAHHSAETFDIADAVVARGIRAWTDEQKSVVASRERWKAIGEALKVGREANPGNQAFGVWCQEQGFGGMLRDDRADAIWLAGNWTALSNDSITTLGHPHAIRKAHRKLTATPPKPKAPAKAPEQPQAAPPLWAQASTTPMDKRAAEKAAKTLQRANYGGEGAG